MKKYKFKLSGLLKVREFKENKIKIELGEINKEVQFVEETIDQQHKDIADGFASQEKTLKRGMDAKMLGFYPYFIQGKKENIERLENKLWALRRKYYEKLEDLKTARGQVKVVENLKEKDEKSFYKEQNKLEDNKLEELVRNWSNK